MLTNQSLKTLLGAFAMIVKSSRTFVCTSDCSTVIPQSTTLLLRAAGPRPELHPQPQPVLGQGASQHLHPDQEPQLSGEGQTQEAAAAGTVQYSTVQYSTANTFTQIRSHNYLERVKLRRQQQPVRGQHLICLRYLHSCFILVLFVIFFSQTFTVIDEFHRD